jgi:multiple sugar transport system substrate-binding protein
MRRQVIVLAAVLVLAPFGAQAADLVVWWEKGFYPQEDEAVAEIIAAFEQETGKQVELVQPAQEEMFDKAQAAIAAGRAPDFLWGTMSERWAAQWAYEGRLVDLGSAISPVFLALFDPDAIEAATFPDDQGRRRLYALPMGRGSNFLHVWNSVLEPAGFTLAAIPKEWNAFWSFWCDQVQPAVRRAKGREDIWAVGLPMSPISDTNDELFQFQLAYGAAWIDRDGRPRVDDPTVRAGLVTALDAYTAIYRKGCTPPGAISWTNMDNNKAFLAQEVVMTPNVTLSIPAALKRQRPDDYYRNAATIDWPADSNGQPLAIQGFISRAVVFRAGANPKLAGDFVRFLAEEGWLAHWLDFAGDRMLPPMRKLVEQPFWLDPSDPHRLRAAISTLTQPQQANNLGEWHLNRVSRENVWGNAVHRIAAEGISPEQAVDEAIARIKQILAE